jgi:hypothetical protein
VQTDVGPAADGAVNRASSAEIERGNDFLRPRPATAVIASNYRTIGKNTLRATADLEIPKSRVKLHGYMWHEKAGAEWISLPSREWVAKDGKRHFAVLINFTDEDVERRALDAIRGLADRSGR